MLLLYIVFLIPWSSCSTAVVAQCCREHTVSWTSAELADFGRAGRCTTDADRRRQAQTGADRRVVVAGRAFGVRIRTGGVGFLPNNVVAGRIRGATSKMHPSKSIKLCLFFRRPLEGRFIFYMFLGESAVSIEIVYNASKIGGAF